MSYIYALTDTWNSASTTFVGIGLNVTDTASAAGSLLLDLQVGGSSKFRVDKTGTVNIVGAASSALTFSGEAIYARPTGSTNNVAMLSQYGIRAASDIPICWTNSTSNINTPDTILARDAANTLAQRNGTNAQTFRVYNTYTDASNYERFELGYVTNVATLRHAFAGTGSSRNLRILTPGNANIFFSANGSDVLSINSGGITFQTDNTYDIGASGANRPRNLFVGGYLSIGDGITAPGAGTGQARIYVDTADGDLKVVFADGTIKTIVTDT